MKNRHPVGSLLRVCMLAPCCVMLALAGCATLHGVPERYQPAAAIVERIQLKPDDLAALVVGTDDSTRNGYINRALAVIDLNFHEFVRHLNGDRQDLTAGGSATALGLSLAGTLVESAAAKTNYAAIAATTVGLLGILDKNYFYEKTVPALVAAMEASRATTLVEIRTGQRETIDAYNGSQALADLERYFSAGTILTAISEITVRADADKQLALEQVRSIAALSDAEIAFRKSLSSAIFAIDENSIGKGKAALKALGLPDHDAVKEIRLELLRAMRPPTVPRLQAVQKALKSASLIN